MRRIVQFRFDNIYTFADGKLNGTHFEGAVTGDRLPKERGLMRNTDKQNVRRVHAIAVAGTYSLALVACSSKPKSKAEREHKRS